MSEDKSETTAPDAAPEPTAQEKALADVCRVLDHALPNVKVTPDNAVAVTADVCRVLKKTERKHALLVEYFKES